MAAVRGLDRAYYSDGPADPIPRLFSATTPLRDYAYDAVPNPTWKTLSGAAHDREYDTHRCDYYYRYRIYIPEWGQFTGPDPLLDDTDPDGPCNYLFCANDLANVIDPEELEKTEVLSDNRAYCTVQCKGWLRADVRRWGRGR